MMPLPTVHEALDYGEDHWVVYLHPMSSDRRVRCEVKNGTTKRASVFVEFGNQLFAGELWS